MQLLMSTKERDRLQVVGQLQRGQLTRQEAARLLTDL